MKPVHAPAFPRLGAVRRCVGAAAFAVCAWGFTAHAAAQDSAPAEAIAHYNLGREHYQAGRYRDALVELEKALALDPHSPNLVYNVARIYELMGDIEHAIGFYERYARMLPASEAEERGRVEATLLRLRGAKEHVVVAPAGEAPAPPKMKRGVADAAFWATLSTGAVAIAAGSVTGAMALDASDDAKAYVLGRDGSVSGREKVVDRADRLALASDVLFLSGATFAVTSILLYVLREKPVERDDEHDGRTGFGFGATSNGLYVAVRGTL